MLEKQNLAKAIEKFKGFKGKVTKLSEEQTEKAKYKAQEKKSVDERTILRDLINLDKAVVAKKYVKYRSLYGGSGRSVSYFLNSEGSEIVANIPSVNFFMSIIVGNGTETRQRLLQLGGTGGFENFDLNKVEPYVLDEVANTLNVLDKGVSLSNQEIRKITNVVMAPEISGIAVHESVGHPHEADRVFGREAAQAGTTYLTPKNLGLEIGSKEITLIDDPNIAGSNGFFLYDDEGVKAQKKILVEKGVQKNLLTNREYAYEMGQKSNGSSRSDSYTNEPIIRMSNTYLKPGNASFDEIISEAKDGVYIKSFTEWNIDDTRSFERYQGNEAYLIKNGRIGKPVKNYKIESKTIDFWHAAKLMGKDFGLFLGNCGKGEPMQGVPVTMGGPTTLLSFEKAR